MLKTYLFSLVIFALPFYAAAQTESVEEFVAWEVESNNVTLGKSKPIDVKHFEIPLSVVESDLASYLPQKVLQALIFEKNGEDYVRWLIHPEDTKWYKKVETYLKSKKLDSTHYKYFIGYKTASRSMILTDPKTEYSFSVKASTDHTAGEWRDKRQEFDDSFDIRFINDLINQISVVSRMENVVTFLEPAAFGIKSINQGIVVRLIDQMKTGKKYYLPGFSALHGKEGARIARINGSDDPAEYWNSHYMKPLGKALAQLMMNIGIQYDSPHSQNFLIELDADLKPTGRIALRDFGDVFLQEEFFKMLKRQDIIERFAKTENTHKGDLEVTVGPLHGNTPPDWMTRRYYNLWLRTFFASYEQEVSKITGVPLAKISKNRSIDSELYSYGTKIYPLFPEIIEHYKNLATEVLKVNSFSIEGAESRKKSNLCTALFVSGF
ncbi:MAG: hypothetical protein A4S09_14560 [Proteobacteria bacterium SG_bin7]|nr:MAG: hypothetical protein A4S09_14560 [Proteobacteria bacterium SG_bin7]